MTFYCRADALELYKLVSNVIASQVMFKPDSILGTAGTFDKDEQITEIITRWVDEGHVSFDEASLLEYHSRESANTKVDLMIYGIGKGYKRPRKYEIYQAFKNSDKILAIATGKENAKTIRDALQVNVLAEDPVTVLRDHGNVIVCGDEEALSLLSKENGRWL